MKMRGFAELERALVRIVDPGVSFLSLVSLTPVVYLLDFTEVA
jgi:hypothetical protein